MNSAARSLCPSAVAGRFFPGEPRALAAAVEECLGAGEVAAAPPCAIISPHAGYPYSGRLAGLAWRSAATARPDRVIILSPSHRHAFRGVALPSQDGYAMPGFTVPIDEAARAMLCQNGLAHVEDAAHDHEHGIETQLPFLYRLHPGVPVVPLVIGQVSTEAVAAIVDALAGTGARRPLFVLSSDLSHFLPLRRARAHDAETARLIETGDAGQLTVAHACGAAAIRGFMAANAGRGRRVLRLGLANSADVTGDTTRTVGYGAWALFDPTRHVHTPMRRARLLHTARSALENHLNRGSRTQPEAADPDAPLQGHEASFVTLTSDGKLRGCVGSLKAHRPLLSDVASNAVKAGFADPRFAALTTADLGSVRIRIAVLSPAAPIAFDSEDDLLDQILPRRDGLILSDGPRRGVFLPSVWESLPTKVAFLAGLKRKAGLAQDHWSETLQVHRFHAETFAEPA